MVHWPEKPGSKCSVTKACRYAGLIECSCSWLRKSWVLRTQPNTGQFLDCGLTYSLKGLFIKQLHSGRSREKTRHTWALEELKLRQENQKGPSHHNERAEHCAKGKYGMQHIETAEIDVPI